METTKYICPMHPEVTSDTPGRCPKCGMDLVKSSELRVKSEGEHKSYLRTYQPLIIIIGLILLTSVVGSLADIEQNNFPWVKIMSSFMAGFFLVFGGFKLLDLKGFAQAYYSYDLLARKWFTYGYIYPFLEIGLGLAYLLRIDSPWLHLFTLVLMAFSGFGVVLSLRAKRKFECACLGTIIKVPLTKITIIEDFGMAIMALLSLLV